MWITNVGTLMIRSKGYATEADAEGQLILKQVLSDERAK